ncbi:hypothetical protein IVB33_29100 [Bradyrhizobium sp. 24]|nr:hypothetical protein [Bradyrhizobium sp. 24]
MATDCIGAHIEAAGERVVRDAMREPNLDLVPRLVGADRTLRAGFAHYSTHLRSGHANSRFDTLMFTPDKEKISELSKVLQL